MIMFCVLVILRTWNQAESLDTGTEHSWCVSSCGGDRCWRLSLGKKRKKLFSAGRWKVRAHRWPVCLLAFLFLWNDREAKIWSCFPWLWFLQTWGTVSSADIQRVFTQLAPYEEFHPLESHKCLCFPGSGSRGQCGPPPGSLLPLGKLLLRIPLWQWVHRNAFAWGPTCLKAAPDGLHQIPAYIKFRPGWEPASPGVCKSRELPSPSPRLCLTISQLTSLPF